MAALLVVVLVHGLTKKEGQEQINMESRFPSGNYLPTAENPMIRVLLKNNGFHEIVHNEVRLSAEKGLLVSVGEETYECESNEIWMIQPDDERLKKGTICIQTKVSGDRIIIHSLERGYGIPSYRGSLELFSTAEGIVIVNEVPLEEYLYAVVPSEMPASYEPEALKCQAICARSYAYCQMLSFGYPEYSAHVDDSVSYQVYGNSKEQESTICAVRETEGKKLWYQNQVIKTYYYSTSCGHSTSVEAWGTKLTDANQYLQGVNICNEDGNDYERNLPWYRWKATIPEKTMSDLVELNTGKEIGELQNIRITKQGVGGVVIQIEATGTKGSVTVNTENKIRRALGGSGYTIQKQDGKVINSTKLLPSAFFTIAKNGGNYIIEGGGYGHGIGMSQNGANEMAKAGKNYEEIMKTFYPGTEVK